MLIFGKLRTHHEAEECPPLPPGKQTPYPVFLKVGDNHHGPSGRKKEQSGARTPTLRGGERAAPDPRSPRFCRGTRPWFQVAWAGGTVHCPCSPSGGKSGLSCPLLAAVEPATCRWAQAPPHPRGPPNGGERHWTCCLKLKSSDPGPALHPRSG